MRHKALQEWNLPPDIVKVSYPLATQEMRSWLDRNSKNMIAQDFRHTIQGPSELVADFIRIFSRAYEKDCMSSETKATLLYGQLQEGLKDFFMRAPAVSGAQTYQELYL